MAFSPGEIRFDRIRRRAGIVLAPILALLVAVLDFPTLAPEAHRLAVVMVAVIALWVSEALPMPVTALLGAAACVVLGVAPARTVFAPFADPLMFLFIGSFILAQGIFRHGLDRRVAFAVLGHRAVAASPARLMLAFGATAAVLSGWISNTATTAMMFGIALAMLRVLYRAHADGTPTPLDPRWATGMMLMTSFAASIGGLATPIGTPPNVIGLGFIRGELGVELPFFSWMLLGVPAVLALFAALAVTMRLLFPAGTATLPAAADYLAQGRERVGAWTAGERSVVAAFGVTVALWILPGILALALGARHEITQLTSARVPEGVAALIGAMLLFVLPGRDGGKALTWREAADIDWGVILLYGGGFALGTLSFQTGLAEALGHGLTGVLPSTEGIGLVLAATVVAVILSETTSNTASANMVVPVVIAIANAAGTDPLPAALGATLGASLGFMLPVSTPCNAIVYASGVVPLSRMMRAGLVLDLVGIVVIVAVVTLIGPLVR